jgi:hypothetical protein
MSGSVATRMAASDDDTTCSPAAMSGNGRTISATANAATGPSGSPRSIPRFHAIGSRIAVASATRANETKPGDRPSSTAILMNR